jgi:hypothetical protein
MNSANTATPAFEVRFESLFNAGRAFTFPCDATGHVNIDGLTDRARGNYFFARGMVGRDFAAPSVVPAMSRSHH